MSWGRDVRLPEGVIAAGRRSYKARMYLSSQERLAGANKSTTGLRSNARMHLSSQERIAGANKSTIGFRSNARMYLSSQARIAGANKINHRVSF